MIAPVALLEDAWRSVTSLLGSLSDDDWSRPTGCPGWTVHDVVAHLVDLDGRARGGTAPSIDEMQVGVAARRADSPAELLGALDEVIAGRLAQLAALPEAALAEPATTPMGARPLADALSMRLMDVWVHEQDIRRAVGRPGNEQGSVVDAVLEYLGQFLGFVVARRAAAPDGSSIRFVVGAWQTGVTVTGRRGVVGRPEVDATTTLTMTPGELAALAGGRSDADPGAVHVDGDRELGRRVVAALGFLP